jgi:hypothetical protein
MDGQRFDQMARMLAGGLSRRAVLRGAAAGLAGAVGLRAGRVGAQQAKKPLCHATGDPANPWVVISVAEPAWQTHYDHGDHDYINCCADADCTTEGHTCGGGGVEGQCGAAVECLGPGDCPPPSDACHAATCVGGVCGTVTSGCGAFLGCQDNPACLALTTTEGGCFCLNGVIGIITEPCAASSECQASTGGTCALTCQGLTCVYDSNRC